jgi:hypothetical protein
MARRFSPNKRCISGFRSKPPRRTPANSTFARRVCSHDLMFASVNGCAVAVAADHYLTMLRCKSLQLRDGWSGSRADEPSPRLAPPDYSRSTPSNGPGSLVTQRMALCARKGHSIRTPTWRCALKKGEPRYCVDADRLRTAAHNDAVLSDQAAVRAHPSAISTVRNCLWRKLVEIRIGAHPFRRTGVIHQPAA